jgi:hypothetical protein
MSEICQAVYNNDPKGVQECIDKGEDPEISDGYLLRFASCYGFFDVVKCLVENRARVQEKAIEYAKEAGHQNIVDYLSRELVKKSPFAHSSPGSFSRKD